jgi:hypothetical protein
MKAGPGCGQPLSTEVSHLEITLTLSSEERETLVYVLDRMIFNRRKSGTGAQVNPFIRTDLDIARFESILKKLQAQEAESGRDSAP